MRLNTTVNGEPRQLENLWEGESGEPVDLCHELWVSVRLRREGYGVVGVRAGRASRAVSSSGS